MAKSFYLGDSRCKMTFQRPSVRAETSTKIWMNGPNPNCNTAPPNSGLNLRNCCTHVRARDSLLSFATTSLFCRSHQGEHPLRGSSLNYSRFDLTFLLHIIYITKCCGCSSRPLELHFVRAWDWCQPDAAALADQHGDCKVHVSVHFANPSPGKWKRGHR